MEINRTQVKRAVKAAKQNLPMLVPLLPWTQGHKLLVLIGLAVAKQLNKNKQVVFYK